MSNSYWEKCVNNMMDHIMADPSMKEYVKRGPPPGKGFMWDTNHHLNKLSILTDKDGHSGASFACCLRACQLKLRAEQEPVPHPD